MHRHANEDEFSHVLEGRVWFHASGEEYVADAGDFVFKPRGEWHTFWNAADEPARILEVISPGGLEEVFRMMGTGAPEADIANASTSSGARPTSPLRSRSSTSTA